MANVQRMDDGRVMRAGITLLEVVIVIVLIVIVLGLLLPVIVGEFKSRFGTPESLTHCASNQRQIVLCMQIYKNQSDGVSPYRPTKATDGSYLATGPTDAASARATAIASLELMAAVVGGITKRLFLCPRLRVVKPKDEPGSDPEFSANGGISRWAAAGVSLGYVYDFSYPSDSGPNRIILADRGRDGQIAHKNKVVVAYADYHTAMITLKPGLLGSGHLTENVPGGITTGVFADPESKDAQGHLDNIYDDANDGSGMFSNAKGSPTRAWVK